MIVAKLLVTIAILQSASSSPSFLYKQIDYEEKSKNPDPSYRLPNTSMPIHYDLKIIPNLETFTFEGEVSIMIKPTVDKITEVVMHSQNLNFTETNMDGTWLKDIIFDPKRDFVTIVSSLTLSINNTYGIRIKYTGKIRDDMYGFYSSYYEDNGETKWLLTTQMQPIYARSVFPCFDEPQYKATFKVAIKSPTPNYRCISNMNYEDQNPEDGLYKFERTPKMSTYLLAFIISQFEKAESVGSNYSSAGIWAKPSSNKMGQLAYEANNNLMYNMEKYTKIKYLEMNQGGATLKMDHAAIPDFSAGAMENWGLITYREAYLMASPKETSTINKLKVIAIIAHELAHMWFGNLVTCHWWSDTWLNEGFARFFQYYNVHKTYPEYEQNNRFIVEQVQAALRVDIFNNTSALTDEVNTLAEIDGRFGVISYNKGASILRMIEHWLRSATFRKGLIYYLTNNTFGVVKPEDLYENLQAAADEDRSIDPNTTVADVMSTWVVNSGYPILKVTSVKNSNNLTLTQERFMKENQSSNTLYAIPVSYTTESLRNFQLSKPKFIMDTKNLTIPGDANGGWIIFNVQLSGYYRVLYDDALYEKLIRVLRDKNRTQIHEQNRAQIVDDAFNFAKENYMSFGRMLDITKFMENETRYTPWMAAFNGFSMIRSLFYHTKGVLEKLDRHILNLMNNLINYIGYEVKANDTAAVKMFRATVMDVACSLKHQGCTDAAQNMFKNMTEKDVWIHPDLRPFVYCNGLRQGNDISFDTMWNKYLIEKLENEKIVILKSLGCTNVQKKVSQLLQNTLDPKPVIRSQDRMNTFTWTLSGNKENLNTTYDFVINNLATIRHVYGTKKLTNMFSSMSSLMNEDQLKTCEAFVNSENNGLEGAEIASTKTAIQRARNTMKWAENRKSEITEWLAKNSIKKISSSLSLLIGMIILSFFSN